jgi:hypothetical protein
MNTHFKRLLPPLLSMKTATFLTSLQETSLPLTNDVDFQVVTHPTSLLLVSFYPHYFNFGIAAICISLLHLLLIV